LHNGITSVAVAQLAGSSGAAVTPFVATFSVGTKITYTDSVRTKFPLQLSRGGLIEMLLSPSGAVEQLHLAGTIARKSTLSGS
jgi:hypothetical protein